MWLKLMDAYLLFFAINQFVCRERERERERNENGFEEGIKRNEGRK